MILDNITDNIQPSIMKKLSLVLIFLTLSFLIPKNNIYADVFSTQYPKGNNNIQNGDILSLKNGYVYKSDYNNLKSIIGVSSSGGMVFANNSNEINVVEKGIIDTYVSNAAGGIAAGDFITISNIKGVGVPLVGNGISIGQALSSFNIKNAQRYQNTNIYIEKIPISIGVAYINNSTATNNISPLSYIEGQVNNKNLSFLQLTTIFIILFSSIFSAMIIIIRGSRNTISKTGRNPLNSSKIIKNFYKVTVISLGIIALGIFLSYLVIIIL